MLVVKVVYSLWAMTGRKAMDLARRVVFFSSIWNTEREGLRPPPERKEDKENNDGAD